MKTWADVPGAIRRVLRKADFTKSPYGQGEDLPIVEVDEANIMTSEVQDGPDFLGSGPLHAPVIDLDLPCVLLASTTPGHFHLIIDKAITWDNYLSILYAMVRAGIVEEGFLNSSKSRGYTAIRLPWVKKEDSENERHVECTCDQLAHPCEIHDCLGGPDF